MEIIAILDKQKLPEDVRAILEKFSKELQDKQVNTNNKTTDNKLYAMQTGTVVGNIYDKNFKLEDKKGDS